MYSKYKNIAFWNWTEEEQRALHHHTSHRCEKAVAEGFRMKFESLSYNTDHDFETSLGSLQYIYSTVYILNYMAV